MTEAGRSRLRAVAVILLVAAAALGLQAWRTHDPRLVYTRFDLPAFDAYAYVAMAEQPRVFTVAPWGYRVLTPTLVHVVAGGEPTRVLRGFRLVNALALAVAAVLVAVFALRLGLAPWAAALGAGAFALSPPVAELLRNPFLTDAMLVALTTSFLLAIEAGAGVPSLVLLGATGALAKESFLLLVPAVYFARRGRDGDRRALAQTAATGLAALAVTLLLREWWTPHLATPLPAAGLDTLAAAAANLSAFASRQAWGAGFALATAAGALLAARRAEGRSLLARYGYVVVVTMAAPFFNPVVFSIGDVRRLLVHALPALIPVMLAALPGAWSAPPPAPASARPPAPRLGVAVAVAAALVILSPFLLDRYRRADLQGRRDGPFVLAFCRESLRTARRLDRGDSVTFDPARREFQWGVSDPGQLDRMRWFLRRGSGDLAHYGSGDVRLHAPEADLALPSLRARALDLTLAIASASEAAGTVLVNGRPVGEWRAPAPPQTWRVPAGVVFRGDNVVTVQVGAGEPREIQLERFTVAPPAQ